MEVMDNLPKFNEVCIDNESEVKPHRLPRLRQLLRLLAGLVIILLVRPVLTYCGVPNPIVTTWLYAVVAILCFSVIVGIGELLSKRYTWLKEEPYCSIFAITDLVILLLLFGAFRGL
jgi:hypothetical protein